ncbi:MAG: hypothetical protein CVV02_11280 [Firmicutes bacterium HGW-Firmicutes-7]|nr:MAG: hypothetical protein CVV02_11280 [Firmicutes bacterium HGW-Firmicutes-7]
MSLNLAFLVLLVLIAFYLIFIEIFTTIFMMTGLSHTRSIFQVISLLTNSGFTTHESEVIVTSRKRRKIAITIMIFGNIFNVLVLSVLVNAVITMYQAPSFEFMQAIVIVAIFFAFFIIYKKMTFIKVRFDRLIKKAANKWMYSKKSNPLLVLDNFHEFCIVEIKVVEIPPILKDKTIFESSLSNDYGIRILYIKRGDQYIGYIEDDNRVLLMDRIIVFGPLHNITKVFNMKPSH